MGCAARRAFGLILLVLGTISGCGTNELESPTAAKLRAVATFYLDYAVAKNGQGPASAPVFLKHVRGLPGMVLEMNGVDPNALETVFVSGRDDAPFVIVYGVSISGMSGTSAPLLAHEQTGKSGKRLVVFANTKVELVDEVRFQSLTAAKP